MRVFFLRRVSEVFVRMKRAARNRQGVARSMGDDGVFENLAKEQPPPWTRYPEVVSLWAVAAP